MRLILILAVCSILDTALAQERAFIREYTYNASESDSRNSSRTEAIEQVKVLLLEEIGLYVESWVQLDTNEDNKRTTHFFKQEVETVTAGITETTIIDETWDGYKYYVKAQVLVDTEDVVKRINQALEAKINSKEIIRLRELLFASEAEVSEKRQEVLDLQQTLEAKRSLVEERETLLASLLTELEEMQRRLGKIEAEEKRATSEVAQILKIITKKTVVAVENTHLGMTQKEVRKVTGAPRSIDDDNYNYGSVWVIFESGIVGCVVTAYNYTRFIDCRDYRIYYPQSVVK